MSYVVLETFSDNHDDLEDYKRTLKYEISIKHVTLGRTHWSDTNRVMLKQKNRL